MRPAGRTPSTGSSGATPWPPTPTRILGDVPVADVNTDLVLQGARADLGDQARRRPAECRGRIERVLRAAKVRGLRDGENPAVWRGHLAEILPKRSKIAPVEHHPALPYEDVPAFVARLRAKKGITALALEFTILTAVRTSEAIGAKFNEFDLAAKVWRIPRRAHEGRQATSGAALRSCRRHRQGVGRDAAQRLRVPWPQAEANRFPTWPC